MKYNFHFQKHFESQEIFFGKDGISMFGMYVITGGNDADKLNIRKYYVLADRNDQGAKVC